MENNSINNTLENIENYINKLNILIIDNLKSICSSKTISELDNKELATIFEYYTAIKLIQKTNKNFTLYSKLTPVQKEKL
jgi:hypothetical protein